MKDKIAFLDRDGIINEKAPENDYIKSWNEFVFREGAIEGIKVLNENGWKVIILTNQRGIARGIMSEKDLRDIHENMLNAIQSKQGTIDAIYYCPHEKETCNCRKPDIGMFLKAENDFNVDKNSSFIIGDSSSDVEAGKRYGIKGYLINNECNLEICVKEILGHVDK